MLSLKPRDEDQAFIRRLLLTVFVFALVVFIYETKDLLLLAFGAVLGAVLFSTIANGIAAITPLPRAVGLAIAVLLFLGVLGLIVWLFGDQIAGQLDQLRTTLPRSWASIQASLEADPLGRMLANSLRQSAAGTKIANWLVSYAGGTVQVIVNFIIIVGATFFATQPELYRRGLTLMVPSTYQPIARLAVDDVGRTLRLWLLTQLASMFLMGAMITFGLWLSGIEAPLALGLLGGLSEFIPYVGPTLAMIPALVVAAAGSGSIEGTVATYLIVRIVQANIITPLITQRVVSVPSGLYLFLILSAGFAFGVFGLFFSGPLAATVYTLALRLYARSTLGEDVALPGEDQ